MSYPHLTKIGGLRLLIILAVFVVLTPALLAQDGDDAAMAEDMAATIDFGAVTVGIALFMGFCAAAGKWVLDNQNARQIPLAQYVLIFLTVVTAVIHLLIGSSDQVLLLANGAGYLLLLLLYLAPLLQTAHKRWLMVVMIVYVLITIVGYFLTHSSYDLPGIVVKVDEVLLLIVLIYLLRRSPGAETP